MATINFTVEDHSIRVDNLIELAQGSNNFDTCAFTFDSSWDGFTLYAVMYQNPKNVFKKPLDSAKTCKIPVEVLKKSGWLYVGARGEKEDQTIATSVVVRFSVRDGAVDGNETGQEMLNESQYEYLLGKINQLSEEFKNLSGDESSGTGLSNTAVSLLLTILENGVYTSNQTGNISSLRTALTEQGGDTGGGDNPEEPTKTDDITVSNGVMTIISLANDPTVSNGVMTVA